MVHSQPSHEQRKRERKFHCHVEKSNIVSHHIGQTGMA